VRGKGMGSEEGKEKKEGQKRRKEKKKIRGKKKVEQERVKQIEIWVVSKMKITNNKFKKI
jgi:hypothetical protein